MVKLNALVIAIAAAPGILAQGARFEVKADDVLCNGDGVFTYSCAGSPNLPEGPLSKVPTFDSVIGFPNTDNPTAPTCGLCFRLTYVTATGETNVRNVAVVSNSQPVVLDQPPVINLCTAAYRNLTGITGPFPSQLFAGLEALPRASCGL